jgi:hypothetical protein
MQRGNFKLGGPDRALGVGKGAAAETAAHGRQREQANAEAIEEGGQGPGPPIQTGGGEQQQALDACRLPTGELHRHRAPHRGTDQAHRSGAPLLQPCQYALQMVQHAGGGIVAPRGPGTEAEAVEVGDQQLVMGCQVGNQPPEFQEGAVEAVEQQQWRPLPHNRHRPLPLQPRQVPPLHGGSQGAAKGIEQAGGRPRYQGAAVEARAGGGPAHEARSSAAVLTRAASRSVGSTRKGR